MARREFQDPRVVVRKTRQGRAYYIRYRVRVLEMVGGKPEIQRKEKLHQLGLCSKTTKAQAERLKAEIMQKVNGQVYTIQAHIPFAEFLRLFEENHLPLLAVPTQKTYRGWIRAYVAPALSEKRLCDIKAVDLQALMNGLKLASSSKKSLLGLLSSIWSRAKAWGYVDKSPVEGVRLQRTKPHYEKTALTPDQIRLLLEIVRPDVALIIETLLWTGARITECLGLRWSAVDLNAGCIRITERYCRGDVGQPKSVRGCRALPLGTMAERFQAWKEQRQPAGTDEYVFTNPKTGEPYQDCELLANYLTPLMKKCGMKQKGMGWRTFRRMHLTRFAETGATVFDVMAQAGHANADTTRLYMLPDIERRKATVRQMQAEFVQ